jgi:quinol monooxygenase YgiN
MRMTKTSTGDRRALTVRRGGADRGGMVIEIALLTAGPGLRDQVRAGLRAGRAVMARMPGYVGSVFHQGLEDPDSFVLRIEWETREAYDESFKELALLTEWRSHFAHLLAAPPKVTPYEIFAGP